MQEPIPILIYYLFQLNKKIPLCSHTILASILFGFPCCFSDYAL